MPVSSRPSPPPAHPVLIPSSPPSMDGTNTVKASAHPAVKSPQTPLRSETRPIAGPYRGGSCFICKQEGHWARDCPNKGRKTTAERPSWAQADPGSNAVPDITCICNRGLCVVVARKFYGCPLYREEKNLPTRCGYTCSLPKPEDVRVAFVREPPDIVCPCGVGWCLRGVDTGDYAGWKYLACPGRERKCHFLFYYKVNDPQTVEGSESVSQCYPFCSCGAGRCRLWMERKIGKGVGRLYFICPVRKGQGACNFHLSLGYLQHKEEMQQSCLTPEEVEESDSYTHREEPSFMKLPAAEMDQASPIDFMTVADYDLAIEKALTKREDREQFLPFSADEHVCAPLETLSNLSGAPTVTETTDGGVGSDVQLMVNGIMSNTDMEGKRQMTKQGVPNQFTNWQVGNVFPQHGISFRQRDSQTWAKWVIEECNL